MNTMPPERANRSEADDQEAPAAAAAQLAELLAELHRGPFEDPPWASFLRRLRRATGSEHANLTFRRGDAPMNELTSLQDGETTSEALNAAYLSAHYRNDPVPYHSLTAGSVYTIEELTKAAGEMGARYARDFLDAAGFRHLRIVRVTEPEGYTAWLTIARRRDQDFGLAEPALLATLAGHLSIALQAFSARETARRLQGLYQSALARLNVAVLILDATGQILSSNEAAEGLLAEGLSMRRDPAGGLRLRSARAQGGLQRLLRAFSTDPLAPHRPLRLSEEPRREMLVGPVRDRPLSGPRTPVLTGYVQAEPAGPERMQGLVELYGLSRSEAKLALALAQGRSIAQAGAEQGLTEESARTYSKRIYQKTGVARQAELVRMVLMSLLVLPSAVDGSPFGDIARDPAR